jgi:sterol desaturase/sphingolipid hydroxylase (fatty acid hydroxylase superfamily)
MINVETNIAVTVLITFSGDVLAAAYTFFILKTPLFDKLIILRTRIALADDKRLKLKALRKQARLTLANVFFFKPLFIVVGLYLTRSFISLTFDRPWKILLDIVLISVISDSCFYFMHGWMHQNKFLFKKIHKLHHCAIRPLPIDYMYEHPLEILIENSGTFLGIMILGHVSCLTLWIYGAVRVVHAVQVHSGIRFTRWPNYVMSGTEEHDLHHFRLNGNYAFIFHLYDRIFRSTL